MAGSLPDLPRPIKQGVSPLARPRIKLPRVGEGHLATLRPFFRAHNGADFEANRSTAMLRLVGGVQADPDAHP